METKAVVLAAGRGTRMGSLAQDRPKPMVEIGGRPALEQILIGIRDAGISKFVIITGHLGDVIRSHFCVGERLGIAIEYVCQKEQNGTAGALRLVEEAVNGAPFLATWGDTLVSWSAYRAIVETYERDPVLAVMAVNAIEDPYKGAAVYFDETSGRIRDLIEKPPPGTSDSKWNQSGLFFMGPKMFAYLRQVALSPRGEYELPDAFRLAIAAGETVRAHKLNGFWGEFGTPEDVARLRALFEEAERDRGENFLAR